MLTRNEVLKLEGEALNEAVAHALGWKPLGYSGVDGPLWQSAAGIKVGLSNWAHDLNAAFALPLRGPAFGLEFELVGGDGIEPRAKLLDIAGRCVALADAHLPATACSRAWLLWKLGVA